MKKIRVAVLGATGMVGQRFITLLEHHPWFEVTCVAASAVSAGKTYQEAVANRWVMPTAIPESVGALRVLRAQEDLQLIAGQVDLVFSALNLDKPTVAELEMAYAAAGAVVVSNNSAHRQTSDVPMVMPEINPDHLRLIDHQRQSRGFQKGLIVVKPNCSLQSFLPLIKAIEAFGPREVTVTTLQAVSGAGKTLGSWPEMADNVIPFIGGEELKTEQEPLRILGELQPDRIELLSGLAISATCIRVPVSDGHMASLEMRFATTPSQQQIKQAFIHYPNPLAGMDLPSAPGQFIHLFEEENRPQTRLDRELENGMAISVGRIRPATSGGWKMVGLSHNTLRGAAGGAVLLAELLVHEDYLVS